MEGQKQSESLPRYGLGEGFAQILHDRSRDRGTDLHRLLISLSTGTLAIYFLALTGEAKPALTTNQKVCAVISVVCVAFSAACGILPMYAGTIFGHRPCKRQIRLTNERCTVSGTNG